MLLKGAMHAHSTCSDGELTVAEVITVYSNLGFDFIALTDHDHLLRPDCYQKQLSQIKTELIVFLGIELTVFEKGYVHVNRIQGEREVLHSFNHPSEMDLPFDKARDRILQTAHKLPLDTVEVTSKGIYTPEFDVEQIPFHKIASDDSHTRLGCGRAWIELDCKRNKDDILRTIKQGESWNCFNTQ